MYKMHVGVGGCKEAGVI